MTEETIFSHLYQGAQAGQPTLIGNSVYYGPDHLTGTNDSATKPFDVTKYKGVVLRVNMVGNGGSQINANLELWSTADGPTPVLLHNQSTIGVPFPLAVMTNIIANDNGTQFVVIPSTGTASGQGGNYKLFPTKPSFVRVKLTDSTYTDGSQNFGYFIELAGIY